jgi:hypothetical protein
MLPAPFVVVNDVEWRLSPNQLTQKPKRCVHCHHSAGLAPLVRGEGPGAPHFPHPAPPPHFPRPCRGVGGAAGVLAVCVPSSPARNTINPTVPAPSAPQHSPTHTSTTFKWNWPTLKLDTYHPLPTHRTPHAVSRRPNLELYWTRLDLAHPTCTAILVGLANRSHTSFKNFNRFKNETGALASQGPLSAFAWPSF